MANVSPKTSRKKYKELLEIGTVIDQKSENESIKTTLNQIVDVIKLSNMVHSNLQVKDLANNTSLVLMDAQVLKMNHELIGKTARKMGESEFSDDAYFNALINLIGPTKDWSKLETLAASTALTTKWSQSMFGAFKDDQPPKEVKKRAQHKKNTQSQQQKEPEKATSTKKAEKSVQRLNIVMQLINQYYEQTGIDIPFFLLITDPNDFMNTVDNAFQLSLLVREGRIYISTNSDGVLTVRPTTQQEQNTVKESGETKQMITTLNVNIWQDTIAQFNISESLLSIQTEHDVSD